MVSFFPPSFWEGQNRNIGVCDLFVHRTFIKYLYTLSGTFNKILSLLLINVIIIWYYESHCMETADYNFLELTFNNIWPLLPMKNILFCPHSDLNP